MISVEGLTKVYGHRTALDNVRSNVAMSRLGARKEGILRAAFVRQR